MATYFHGNPEIQPPDGLQTLVLMNPSYIHYPDTPPPHPSNFVFLNSIAAGNNSVTPQNLHHVPPNHTQQFVGIPLPTVAATSSSQDPGQQHSVHPHQDGSTLHGFVPRMQCNLWNQIDPNATARETPRTQQQGLSLSLSSQQAGMGSFRADRDVASQGQAPAMSGEDFPGSGGSPSSVSGVTNVNGVSGIQSVLLSSKYLKAAQELLDEAVNVNNGIKTELGKKSGGAHAKATGETSGTAASADGSVGGEGNAKRDSELSAVERQEIQMKKAKLISMLDEVDPRYRQYHQQMQIVISSFEQAAGIGAARTYTALALQTISKKFRCLKDAISDQIRAANKSLGEEDSFGSKMEGSRLKYVDHHLRQQRALQQLGMIHHNAWRPQRGLPERSVSVLRAWLFEHFLHPYPKDSDKHMLAKQTGLTRSQVSNWFINARVRLWKPMVEEMYMEEMKEQGQNGSEDKSSRSGEDPAIKTAAPRQKKGPATETDARSLNCNQDSPSNHNTPTVSVSKPLISSPTGDSVRNQFGFSFMGSLDLQGITQGSPKKPRNHEILHFPTMDVKPNEANNEQLTIKFGEERQGRDEYSFMGTQANFIGGFGQYPIGEIGRFEAEQFAPRFSGNNGVSLTLGLPHCDTLSGSHQTFLPNQNIQLGRRLELGDSNEYGAINPSTTHSSAAFENMNMQNPKRFAAQLLPDFVT
ncbi:hypothetical protein QN277_021190 [Acacia crassicarpa]|uniref:Homeobox domain-containing protein n=1 Tax=Acacia crassicarpa TaxID=499986 RepID=A0AAE1JPP7_9FABA|nr:hypothetical protein QN277_021190 [Acacia crassicarpa]